MHAFAGNRRAQFRRKDTLKSFFRCHFLREFFSHRISFWFARNLVLRNQMHTQTARIKCIECTKNTRSHTHTTSDIQLRFYTMNCDSSFLHLAVSSAESSISLVGVPFAPLLDSAATHTQTHTPFAWFFELNHRKMCWFLHNLKPPTDVKKRP